MTWPAAERVRLAGAAELDEAGEVARAALTYEAGEGAELVRRLARRRGTAAGPRC